MSQISLLLDNTFNDLVLASNGDIAVASDPYRMAQDAACAIRTFIGEIYFDPSQGIPYWSQILGKWPTLPLVKRYLQQAALTVTGVASATVYITRFDKRTLYGTVIVISVTGQTASASF